MTGTSITAWDSIFWVLCPLGAASYWKWHWTDHPTYATQLKCEPVITTHAVCTSWFCLTNTVDTYIFKCRKMADPIGDLNAVLQTCSIEDQATCTNIINQEGFMELADLGVLETDTDVTEMAKRMAMHTQAEGRVLLRMVMIKCLQSLVWWVQDHQKQVWITTCGRQL